MSEKVEVLGVSFDNLTMNEAVNKAMEVLPCHKGAFVVTPNPEIVMICRKNHEAATAVSNAYLTIPDGIGIIYGAKILKTPLKEKIPGCDFTLHLMEEMQKEGRSIFLLGSKPGVAVKAMERLRTQFPELIFAGTNDGYFTEDMPVIEKINKVKPDVLLVCLGAPKQEIWMDRNSQKLDVGLMIGAGGSLDVFAGTAERAPENWRRAGLEWLYRLMKEPRRIGRMMSIPKFLFTLIFMRKK